MKNSRRKSMKQKLAVALSVVNALNVCAPVALPYVNVARNVRADGGQAEPLTDGLARAFYGTAQASDYRVPNGGSSSVSVGEMGSDDTMTISSGGTGTVNTMNGGQQDVYSSGTGSVTTMGGGDQQVNNGGVGTVTTMNGGEQRVYEGGKGTVNEMTNDNATQDIDGGEGTVNNLSNGNQVVKNGGTGTVSAMLNNHARQYIENGGKGTVSTMKDGAQWVHEGGTGTVTSLDGGSQVVWGGGTSLDTTIASGGKQIAADGAILAGTQTVEAGGVATGGTLTNITVSGLVISATQNVNSGGRANNTTVNSGGMQVVFDGGSADHTTVATSGSQVVSGGRLTSTHVESNAAQHVYGGTVISTTLGGSGACQNLSGGVASGTIINDAGASQNINAGATAGNTIISSGTQYVSSGGTASGTTVSGGTQNILNSGTATGTILSGGDQVVNDGGTGTGTTINSGGTQYVSGGTVTNTTVNSEGMQNVSGGRVTDTHVKGNANQYVYGGVVSGTTLDEGDACQTLRGGTAVGTIINTENAHQIISSGGKADNTVIHGGDQLISAGGTATDTILSGGSQFIDNGGTATGTQIYGGTQSVASGGQATNATVAERGTQLISSGGTATDTHVMSGGTQNVKRGGVVSGGMVEKGAALAFEDPDDVKGLSGGGGRIITKDGSVDGGTLIGGEHDVVSGVTVSGMTLEGGAQTIASGGTAVATTISAGAAQPLNAGGMATSTTISSGGVQTLEAGGMATATTISAGGVQTLQKGTPNSPGGVSEHIALEGGTLVVDDYARAQIDEAEGGVLRLLDLGLAEAQFGALDVPSSVTNYEVTTLYARGDNVRLGLGDESNHSAADKTLNIGTLDGYANFIVNTDLKNNRSDRIVIGSATNAAQANTVQINHDPTLAKGEEVPSANATVATVGSGKATFEGVKSTINSIDYFPEIETTDGGRTWVIRRVLKSANNNTHSTVMGMTAGLAALSAGNDFIGAATEGLSLTANEGRDGVAAFAKLGDGRLRQDTGSHVDVNTWNAILALGHKNRKEKSSFEYGAFFEYGSGNYTTHDGDNRGDGSAKYTGGGLLAKWTAAHGLYVEGSLRAGTVHDDASSVLRDAAGNAYGYETDAGYFGAHIGVGKEIPLANGDAVDVYGKFFYNRRNGVSFTANNSDFDLDAVKSEILRVGARYTVKREKWNFYGGVAYEHEFGGEATGTVNGLPIRSADIKGGSARLELGATMKPDKNSPWSLDLNVAGFAGKKQGVSGGISVSFMF